MRKLTTIPVLAMLILVVPALCLAQRGKDGAKTISSSVNVNEYTPLSADVSAGSTTISVSNSALNTNGYFSGSLAAGDLVFIIQMQGASMSLNNDSTYGNVNVYNNCGNNEFAQVKSVPNSTTITLDCGLQHSYTATGRVQVVRVPRWSSLTINSGGVLTCPTWNVSTGGVLVVEVLGNTIINSGGSINTTGKGFRGGALDNLSQFGTGDFRYWLPESGAEKGEGIAGNQGDYDNFSGRYDRGAPANGAGGGDGHTSGGGGGGNAGNIATWNGYGVPDVSTGSWASAWNLEWSGFATNNSSGGGRGGYSYSSDDRNALVEGPGNTNWSGDFRRNVGGFGGRPLDYSTGRLFLGGGGGAGDQNQNKGGAGGNGGGMIYVYSFGTMSGSGQVISNGANGGTTPIRGTDAAGGAGAGGTIVLNSTGTISGISITANGGNGGNQIIRNIFEPTEAEGTGGGGGGGYISITNGSPTRNANGGANGITDSGGLLEFPPNGATKGGVGLPTETFNSYYLTGTNDTICPNNTATLVASVVGTAPSGITYSWYANAAGGNSISTGAIFNTPSLSSSTTYYVEICPGFYRVPVEVVVTPSPTASFTATTACLGTATVFTNTSTGGATYSWNFGDGNNSAQTNPSHTYATSGTFVVVLTVTSSAGCIGTVTQNVTVGTTPQVSFTSSGATTSCGPMTVTFVNNTTGGGANTYSWTFGDGGTSSQQNPSHTYSTPGTYTVVLSASLGICNDIDSIVNYITINPVPNAGFNATTVCLGNQTNFTNTTTGGTSYSWTFGDGGTSSSTNPTHTYATANTFTVTMITSNGTCSDTAIQSVVVSNQPQVSFSTPGATTGCGSLTVGFVNNTTGGGVNTYTWNFGDGNTSGNTNPIHTYNTPGTYTVTLSAVQGSCNDIDSIVNYITVHPVPNATFSSTNVCLGDVMNFTNSSTGATGYNWTFGDGGTSTAANPSHTYASANTFIVTMIATNGFCTDTAIQNVVVSNSPQVSFTSAGPTTGCGSLTVNFTNNTTGGGANAYAWNFGDGNNSSQQNPSHTYSTPGTYTVTLSATLGSCSDIDSIVGYITVNPAPAAAFSSTNICLGDVMNFTNASTGATGYSWTFGDGGTSTATSPSHTYATANTFTVTLIATNGLCNDTVVQSVVVNNAPQVSFTTSGSQTGCTPFTVTFVNNTTGGGGNSYNWIFGDGGTSSLQNPSYTYTTAGTYTVTLSATLGSCSDVDSIVGYVIVLPTPTAGFTATSVCLGDPTIFGNTSSGASSYSWDFGDGNTSSSANPSHTYATANTFTVTLVAHVGPCTDTIVQNVVVNNAPQVSFTTADPTTGCGSLTVNFTNNTTGGGGNSYNWDFGDGTGTSSLQNPTYTYSTPGTYTVVLAAALGSCNDVDSIVNYITVNPAPTAAFSAADVCLGDAVNFSNSSSGATGYSWDFGDGIGTSSQASPSYTYTSANTFTVTLIASDGTCTDTITQSVVVSNAPQVSFTTTDPTSGCGSLTVNFTNNTTGGGGNSYAWDFGDGSGSSSLQNPTYTYSTPGTYTVTLTASLGSCSDVDSIVNYITVNPAPTAAFTAANVCLGDIMNFNNTSTGATSYAWDFGDGSGTSSATSPSYTYASANTYTVSLIATNGTCVDTITQSVVVNNAPQVSFTSTGATTGCGSVTLNFINNTTGGGGNNYLWNFGDGGTSTLQDPTYTFSIPGTYTVVLTATIGSCTDVDSLVNYVTVTPGPIASFTAGSVCLGEPVNFMNTSTGATNYLWDFGDGSGTSSLQDPTHIYTVGNTYTIILISSDGNCSDTITQTVTVNPPPIVNFIASATSACDSLTVTFTNTTTGAISYNWDFGDGFTSTDVNPVHTYNTPGTYSVILDGVYGICVSSHTAVNLISIYETPHAVVSASQTILCLNDCINFTSVSTGSPFSWAWNFPGSSTGFSTQQNPLNICYPSAGSFNVVLNISNGNCSSSETLSSYIVVSSCTTPIAGFFSNDTVLCKGSCINFTSTSQNASTFQWSFPGATPSSSTQPNPNNICYPVSGFYDVTLIVSNGITYDTLTVTNYIQVAVPPTPPTFAQNGDTLISSPAFSYQWYFGNFAIGGGTNQTYVALASGNYHVVTTDANGCSATSAQSWVSLIGIEELEEGTLVYIYPNPVEDELTLLIESNRRPKMHYELSDAIGKKLSESDFTPVQSPFKREIDMTSLPAGIYFISVETTDSRIVRKIVKQ
jgi:PKD repeat protein